MESCLVVVVGASSGIGSGFADSARDSGAIVRTCSRSGRSTDAHLSLDLSLTDSWTTLASWLDDIIGQQTWGQIILVHSAATIQPIGLAGTIDLQEASAAAILNSVSPLIVGNAFLAAVAKHGGSSQDARLIQISSGAGKRPFSGWSMYCAAKAGVDLWVRTAGAEQVELGTNTKVLSIGPGVVATAMQESIRQSEVADFPAVEQFRAMNDEGALADPDEVGAKLFRISVGDQWESGDVVDIRDFD